MKAVLFTLRWGIKKFFKFGRPWAIEEVIKYSPWIEKVYYSQPCVALVGAGERRFLIYLTEGATKRREVFPKTENERFDRWFTLEIQKEAVNNGALRPDQILEAFNSL